MKDELDLNDLNNVKGGLLKEQSMEEVKLSKLFRPIEKSVENEKDELFEEDLDKYIGGVPASAFEDEEFASKHK